MISHFFSFTLHKFIVIYDMKCTFYCGFKVYFYQLLSFFFTFQQNVSWKSQYFFLDLSFSFYRSVG